MDIYELNVFTDYYSALCHTLTDVDSLLPQFVQKRVITIGNLEEINVIVTSTKKVQKLMVHISGPLEAGNTEVFYIMLRIMEEYGHHATQQLAKQIRRSLPVNNRNTSHRSTAMTMNKPKMSTVHVQITRGMCVFGATMLCSFCFLILMGAMVILLALMYSSEHMDIQIMINGIRLQISAVERHCLPPEIFQNADHLQFQDKQMDFDRVNDNRTIETVVNEVGVDDVSSTNSQVDNQKIFIPQMVAILEVPFTKTTGNKEIYSRLFFAFEGGYLMRLIVPAVGSDDTHLSVFLQLMKGPYDDSLYFPMYGHFVVELISQETIEVNRIEIISYRNTSCSECTNRVYVTNSIGAMWIGHLNFASLESVNAYYGKDDSLQFRITYTHYFCYANAMRFLKRDIYILLAISVLDGFMVYCLLILVEFVAFCIQESSILIPTCIDFSIDSMKRFLFTKQDVLLGTGHVVLHSTSWILVRFYLISVTEIVLLAVGEFMVWNLATAMDYAIPIIKAGQRFMIFAFSVAIVNEYEMSWRKKIFMINPICTIVLILVLLRIDQLYM